jgi:hypothetical protein
MCEKEKPLTNLHVRRPGIRRNPHVLNVNLWEIRFEVSYRTAFVVAVPATRTRHGAPDLSQGHKEEDNDHSSRNVELWSLSSSNSERPSTGSSSLRRLYPPAMTVFPAIINFLSVDNPSEVKGECGGRGGRFLCHHDVRQRHVSVW